MFLQKFQILKCFKQKVIFLLLYFFYNNLYAQNDFNFFIDTTYFKNEEIKFVSKGLDYNVWVIKGKDSREISYINNAAQQIDLSSDFQSYVNSTFADILGLRNDSVLVGTNNNYLLSYCKGKFSKLNEPNGITNANINSIVYLVPPADVSRKYEGVMVGTDSGLFVSGNFINYRIVDFNLNRSTRNNKHIARYSSTSYTHYSIDTILRYPSMDGMSDKLAITYTTEDIMKYEVYSDFFPPYHFEAVNSVVLNRIGVGSPIPIYIKYWGTNTGLKMHFPGTRKSREILSGVKVNKLIDITYFPESRIYEQNYLMIGTDSGLYYSKLPYTGHEKTDTIIKVKGTSHLKIYDMDKDICSNSLWLATNQGLIKVLLNYDNNFLLNSYLMKQSINPQIKVRLCEKEEKYMSVEIGTEYQWLKDGKEIPNANSFSFAPTQSGAYQCIINSKFCSFNIYDTTITTTFIFEKIQLPQLQHSKKLLCDGDTLQINLAKSDYKTYWYKDGQELYENFNKNSLIINQSGIYTVTYQNDINCANTSQPLPLIFNPVSNLIVDSPENILCNGDSVLLSISTNAKVVNWSNGVTGLSNYVTKAGDYEVSAINKSGCIKKDLIHVSTVESPVFSLGNDTSFCEGKIVPIHIEVAPGYEKYEWDEVSSKNNAFDFYSPGIHTLKITDKNNCFSKDTLNIINNCLAFNIPNLITPNGDGENETFFVENLLPQCPLTIFNKWGNKVYFNDNYKNDWSAEGLEDGIFYYLISSPYFKQKWKGWIQIVR